MSAIFYKNLPYGAGGSNVEANPSGSATGDLTKVGIDGTVYDVTDADAVHSSDKGVANGVASLDATGRVPSTQLPSYVDDVLEYASQSAFPATGESGKIYIALDTNKTYRWSGSAYVEISESLALGTTHSTAAYGDDAVSTAEPSFSEASTRANLAGSGEKLSVIFGKIKKWFTDLKDLAFIGKDGASSTKYLRGDGTWQNFPSIPAAQVQSDWNQTDSAQVDFIKNKPDIDLEGSKTATGNPITLTDASESYAEELEVELEPIQSGSGTPSPSNIRPITGYTDVNVGSVGRNLFDKSTTTDGKLIGLDGVISNPTRFYSDFIPIKGNTDYYLSNVLGSSSWNTSLHYDKYKNLIGDKNIGGAQTQSGKITSYPNSAYMIINGNIADKDVVQVEEGSTATTYEPYHSNTTHTPLGRTVYGGKSNFTNGGTDDGFESVDLSTLSFNRTNGFYYTTLPDAKKPSSNSEPFNAYFDRGEVVGANGVNKANVVALTTTGALYITTSDYDGGSLVSPTGQLVYEKATYDTIDTPPTDLKLLDGINTITSNGTTISLKYQPDNVIGEAIGVSEEYTDRRTKWKVFGGLTNGSTLDLNALRQYDEALFCLFNGSYFPCRVDSIYMPTAYDVALTLSGNIRPYYGGSDVLYGEIDNSGNVTITRGNTADNFSSIIVYVR